MKVPARIGALVAAVAGLVKRPPPQPCATWWQLKTNGARKKHLRGAGRWRGCSECRRAVIAEIKRRGL